MMECAVNTKYHIEMIRLNYIKFGSYKIIINNDS